MEEKQPTVQQNFQYNLRTLRVSKDLSPYGLNMALQWKEGRRVDDLESGNEQPTLDELIDLSIFFGYSIGEILERKFTLSVLVC